MNAIKFDGTDVRKAGFDWQTAFTTISGRRRKGKDPA